METNKSKQETYDGNYAVVALFILAGIICSCLYIYLSLPIYRSTAKISIPVSSAQTSTIALFGNTASVATEEIKTPEFLTKAFENNAGLVATFIETDYKKVPAKYSFPFDIKYTVTGNKNFQPQHYKIIPSTGNSYTLESKTYGITRTKQGVFGEKFIDNNLELIVTKKAKPSYQTEAIMNGPVYSFTIHSASSKSVELINGGNKLEVEQSNGILAINVCTESPYTSALLADAIAENYLNAKSGSTNNTTTSQSDQLETIAAQLSDTEQEISKYKRENQITDIHADGEKNLSMLKELQMQKTQLEVQLAALDNLTTYLRKNREINNSQVEYGSITDPAFAEQISQLNKFYDDKKSGASNGTADAEIENLKVLISERILNTRKKTAVQIDKVSEAIAVTQNNLSRLPDQANTILALERKMQLDKKVYDMLIENQANAIVNGIGTVPNARIIAPATQSATPVWPVGYLVVAIGALTGLIAGLFVSRMINQLKKSRINNRSAIDQITRLPFIAAIGDLNSQTNVMRSTVNNLCTAVLMKPQVKVITFASSHKSAGKTFIATQLAQELAAVDKKVLLIDMNLNNPEIAEHYSITSDQTLTQVLEGSCDVHDAIRLTAYPNLEVLTPGELSAGINTLLSSKRKEEILATIKKHYDYIIIDTSETSNSLDAAAMMKISDLNLYVVNSNTSRKSSLVAAERIQSDYNIPEMYLVLNSGKLTSKTKENGKNRTRNRSVNVQRAEKNTRSFVPGVLKRIALWFY